MSPLSCLPVILKSHPSARPRLFFAAVVQPAKDVMMNCKQVLRHGVSWVFKVVAVMRLVAPMMEWHAAGPPGGGMREDPAWGVTRAACQSTTAILSAF